MAAGRHGLYNRENDFREQDSSFEFRNGNREADNADDAQDLRDRIRARSNEEPGGVKLPAKNLDREPGELSSESGGGGGGSDDAIESVSRPPAREFELGKVVENGVKSPPKEKKRKFSPIVWDRDDNKGGSSLSKTRLTTFNNRQSPSVSLDTSLHVSSGNAGDPASVKFPEAVGNGVYESPVEVSSPDQKLEDVCVDSRVAEQMEDEDYYVSTRNISSSRWAGGNDDSPLGVSESEEIIPKKRNRMPGLGSAENEVRSWLLTPDEREVKKVVSEDEERDGRSSGDDYRGDDLKRDEYMDVDKDYGANDSVGRYDTTSEYEPDSPEAPEPAAPPQRVVNMRQGCRSVDAFERLNKIDEGTYGVVYRAQDKQTSEIVALKKVKMEKEREGFPLTSLREINILLSFHHPYIVDVKEVVVGRTLDSIFMVMEYMEHDLKALMETMRQPFSPSEVKCLMLQLLEGVKYLHDNWVLHRDLKTSNLLLNNRGELKICDFGLARQYGSPLKPYTHMVVTLWYRAPELLLGAREYSTAIDMWSLGCIMAEMLSKEPLFNGRTEVEQLDKIFKILGTPNETIWPEFSKLPGVKVNFVKHRYNLLRKKFPATSFTGSPVLTEAGFDLLNKLLTYDPEKRITADAALNHEWFREVPLPKTKDFMPTFPAQHAQDRRSRRIMRSPDPLEEQRRKELQGGIGTGGVFG